MASKGSKGLKASAAAAAPAADTKPAKGGKSGKGGKKFIPTFEEDDVKVYEMLTANPPTAKFFCDWAAMKSYEKGTTTTRYGEVLIMCVGEDGKFGEPHHLNVRTAFGQTLRMNTPGEGYQKAETPSYIVTEGSGRGAQPEGADTRIYDSEIRKRINEFLKAELAPGGAGEGYCDPTKQLDSWMRFSRKEKDEKGRQVLVPYETGPYLVMTTGRFTKFYNGLDTYTDPQTGTVTLSPLKLRGKHDVTAATLHHFLQDHGTLATSSWRPCFNISGYGLSPHAELQTVVVFPDTGKKTAPPTADRLMGTRVQADMAALQKMAAANRASAGASAADDEFDAADDDAEGAEEDAEATEDKEEDEEPPAKSKSKAPAKPPANAKARAVQQQLESEPGTDDDDPSEAPRVTAAALLKPGKPGKAPAKTVKPK